MLSCLIIFDFLIGPLNVKGQNITIMVKIVIYLYHSLLEKIMIIKIILLRLGTIRNIVEITLK